MSTLANILRESKRLLELLDRSESTKWGWIAWAFDTSSGIAGGRGCSLR